MKIAVVNLDSPFLINPKVFPPLGILYIASALRREGHEPVWYDFAGGAEYKVVNENIVFITITSPQLNELFEYVKCFCEGKRVIVGGCGVQSLTKERKLCFDIAFEGEADNCISDILHFGIKTYNCQVNLDKVEFPARDLIKGYEYKINGRSATTMITSRGCPYNCIFCVSGNIKGFRIASVERVCQEIDKIFDIGYRALMFFDDLFTLNKKRLKIISDYLSDKGFLYRCFSHINSVDDTLCNILADSGCVEVGIGIESLDNQILKTVKKGFTVEKATKAIKLLLSYNIRVKTFFMLGLPGESYKSIDNMKRWLHDVKPSDVDFSIYSPFPNTEIWDNKNKYDISWNGKTSIAFKGIPGKYDSLVSTSSLSRKDIIEERDKLEREFKHVSSS